MSKETMKTNVTANTVTNAMLEQKEFLQLYSISDANMNRDIENHSNRVVEIKENVDLSKQIISTMKLQDDFFDAVSRIQVWIDSNAIVVFVGAVFTVHASMSAKKAENKEKAKRYSELFKQSIDTKYNEKQRKGIKITALTETRHKFTSIDEFTEFFNLLSEFTLERKKALAETAKEQKAEQKAEKEQKATKQKEQKNRKQKTKEIEQKAEKAN